MNTQALSDFSLNVSGSARSSMPLLLNVTYTEFVLLSIAAVNCGYFPLGIVSSISVAEI
jgi:hypothetical protein